MNRVRPSGAASHLDLFEQPASTRAVALLVFGAALIVFLVSPVRQIADSKYSMVLSQSLWERGRFDLDGYFAPDHDRYTTRLETVNGHLYYAFPPGSSLLSVPFVGAMNMLGVAAVRPGGLYDRGAENAIQAFLAALLMAGLAAIIFETARRFLPLGWSLAVAAGGAFGSQVWSTASRGLWSDTWGIFLIGCVVWLLVRVDRGEARQPVLLATLLSWSYFVRPTNSVAILAVTVYILAWHRGLFLRYALTGGAWLALFIGYSWLHFGTVLPSYFQAHRLGGARLKLAAAGILVSPSRGLLVFVPTLFFVAYLIVRYRRHLPQPRLVWIALATIVGHVAAASSYWQWWAGHSYGARFTTGLVPWFALLAILGLRAMLKAREEGTAGAAGKRWEHAVAATLLLASLFVNGRGATSYATVRWNQLPVDVDEEPRRVFDWRRPQFLAGFLVPGGGLSTSNGLRPRAPSGPPPKEY